MTRPAVTRLKVTCPTCGHVRLAPADVRLVVGAPPRGSYYLFRCPQCDVRVRRPAPPEIVTALVEHGVPTVRALPHMDPVEPGGIG